MIKILITDTHFGCRQNSITWLNAQIKFLKSQLIPKIKQLKDTGEYIRLIHLGDVFDSRSSISPMVAKIVRDKFIEISNLVDDFYIVAGNHDFYSPNTPEYDTLSMVFRDCGIRLVINEVVEDNDDLFIPWYQYKEDIDFNKYNAKNIYTHADIFGVDKLNITKYADKKIFSGHVHVPNFDEGMGLYNIGSCYALDFADSNQDRFFYIYRNNNIEPIINNTCIKFFRLYNEQIFNDLRDKNDYYEFYIKQSFMQVQKYQKRIAEIANKYKNMYVIPVPDEMVTENEQLETYDIEDICKKSIPSHLKDKFNMILNNLNQ